MCQRGVPDALHQRARRNRVIIELRVSQSSAQFECNHPHVIAIIEVTLYQVEWHHHVNETVSILESPFC